MFSNQQYSKDNKYTTAKSQCIQTHHLLRPKQVLHACSRRVVQALSDVHVRTPDAYRCPRGAEGVKKWKGEGLLCNNSLESYHKLSCLPWEGKERMQPVRQRQVLLLLLLLYRFENIPAAMHAGLYSVLFVCRRGLRLRMATSCSDQGKRRRSPVLRCPLTNGLVSLLFHRVLFYGLSFPACFSCL